MHDAAKLAALCVVGVAFAGCGAVDDGPGPTGTAPAAGRIHGRVIDDSQSVVEGAAVRILLTSLVAKTDAGGEFAFEEVPAGPLRLVASAEGFTTQTRSANLTAGSVLVVNFVLAATSRVEPFHDTLPFNGRILCSLPQGAACPSDPEGESFHRFEGRPGLRGMVLELQWTPTASGVNAELAMDVQAASPSACGDRYAGAEGGSVLRLLVEEGFPISGGHQCVTIRGPNDAATVDQAYQLYVTLFYHEPPPADFSAISG